MHDEVIDWVRKYATDASIRVLDIGGRDVNGTPRKLFPNAVYTVLDKYEGLNVDIVADAASWTPECPEYDLVLCTEVFEHTPHWPEIVRTAYRALKPGGEFVATMAGPGRGPHSGIEATGLRPGEYYRNVEPIELVEALLAAGFTAVDVDQLKLDVRCFAVKDND